MWVLYTLTWAPTCRFQRVSTPAPLSHCYVLCAYLSDAFDGTNSFGVTLLVPSLLCGLLHDVFQYVSADPIPIEICYGMLSNATLARKLTLVISQQSDALVFYAEILRL